MTSKLSFVLFMALALVACTKDSEPLIESVVDQNEVNICQLKSMASDAGWAVTPKAMDGDRTTPLTEAEIKDFQEDLQEYSVYPKMQEEREVEVVPVENRYIFMLPFALRFSTKSYSSGSIIVYANYGYCYTGKCCRFPIKVYYDLDEHGDICYAFAGSDFFVKDCGCPHILTTYTTAYYRCEWNTDWVYIAVWLNCSKFDNISTHGEHFMVTGTVYINTGVSYLDIQYVGEGVWPPVVDTR